MVAARWCWINRRNGYHRIDIVRRPEEGFEPKGRPGSVPIHDRVLAVLMKLRRPDDPYILPGGNKTARLNLVVREFAAWMRAQGWKRRETAHELRKYRGHLWKDKYGVDVAHDWLRHANWQTTIDYYADISNSRAPLPLD
jgi:integrase